MKGDHLFEEVQLKPPNSMFPKLHSQPSHSPLIHSHQHQLQHQHQPHQQLLHQLTTRECHNNSEEEESRSSGGCGTGGAGEFGQSSGGGGDGGGGGGGGGEGGGSSIIKRPKKEGYSGGSGGGGGGGGGDGASIEVSRRPRGRPPGSKNKPKPPIIITRDIESAMRPHILEISTGLDIIDSLARFARQRNVGLCVLNASGSILNVSLRQPSNSPNAAVTFHGRFDILSISATYLPPSANSFPALNGCTISLSGPQGQIFGGSVMGSLIAATNVFIVATSFTTPTYHRLPIEDEVPNTSDTQVATPAIAAGPDTHSTPSDSGANAMTIYNCTHLPTDVIWTPTARPPSQHY